MSAGISSDKATEYLGWIEAGTAVATVVAGGYVLITKGGKSVAVVEVETSWLDRVRAGNEFNRQRRGAYEFSELYVVRPDGKGYYIVDGYDPIKGEIVSRKFTQLGDISEATARSYISEAVNKYPSGSTIASVRSTPFELRGQNLNGTLILEIPPQAGPVPQSIINYARENNVVLRDINGKTY